MRRNAWYLPSKYSFEGGSDITPIGRYIIDSQVGEKPKKLLLLFSYYMYKIAYLS